jgi:hypothetical protein
VLIIQEDFEDVDFYLKLRNLPCIDRLEEAAKIKEKGNKHFHQVLFRKLENCVVTFT